MLAAVGRAAEALVERFGQPAFEPSADVLAMHGLGGIEQKMKMMIVRRRRGSADVIGPSAPRADMGKDRFDEGAVMIIEKDRIADGGFALKFFADGIAGHEGVAEFILPAVDGFARAAVQPRARGSDGDVPGGAIGMREASLRHRSMRRQRKV